MSSARERLAAARQRLKAQTEPAMRTITSFLAGAAVGELERRGVMPASVFSLPTKPVLVLGLHAFGRSSGLGKHLLNAAPGVAGAYGYAAALKGTLVAGEGAIELG